MSKERRGERIRETKETRITVGVDLDGSGEAAVATGVGFYDHLLTSLSHHSLIDIEIDAAGDIEIDAEKKILENSGQIKSQVLKSPHHGSLSSSTEAFLHRISPEIVVISLGEGNRYGFPDQGILERYKKIGAKVFRTDVHGAVEVSSDGRTIFIRTAQ